ncbi:ABC transporter permease [Nitrospirota bacterium]
MAFGITRIAIRNITRRPLRSGVLSFGSAVLAGAIFVLGAMYLSVTGSVERAGKRLGADAMVVHSGWSVPQGGPLLSGGPTAAYLDPGTVARIKQYHGVAESTEQLFIVSASLPCCTIANAVLVGFVPETDFTISPWLRDEGMDRLLMNDEIVAGPNILSEPGGRIRFFDKVFRVAAKLEPTGLPMMDNAVFIPMDGAREMIASAEGLPLYVGPGQVSAVMLRFQEQVNHNAVSLRMEYEIPGTQVVLAREAMASARENMLAPLRGMALMSALWWLVSMMLSGALYGVVLESRRDELRMLRSLGASRRHIFKAFSLEVLVLSLSGSIVGVAVGCVFIGRIMGGLPLPGVPALALLSAASVCACLISSFVSTAYPLLRNSPGVASGAAVSP